MKKYFFLAAAAAMMLSACSFDRELDYGGAETTPKDAIPLTVGYALGDLGTPSVTRGNNVNLQNDSLIINTGDTRQFGLFVLKAGTDTPSETYERTNLPSTSLGKNNPTAKYTLADVTSTDTYKTLLYPEDKSQAIDIYAYAPYKTLAAYTYNSSTDKYEGTIGSTNVFSYTTETNQTAVEDYWKSDVLWGCAGTGTNVTTAAAIYSALGATAKTDEISAREYLLFKNNVTKTASEAHRAYTAKATTGADDGPDHAYYFKAGTQNSADVIVPMLHRGSKIIVNVLTSGMAKSKLQNAVVKFYVDYTVGELNIKTGEFKVPSGTSAPASATAITLTDHLGIVKQDASPTEEGSVTVTNTDDAYTCCAVIVPQTAAVANNGGNGSLITIDLKDATTGSANTTATYSYKLGTTTGATAPTFASGKKYIYNITVKASGLSVTTTVADWSDDTSSLPGGNGDGNAELQ